MRIVLGLVAILFGIVTVKQGGSVLFIDGEARRAAGHYVPFILWFNFLAGFAYVAAGIGILRSRPWSRRLAQFIAGATLVFFALFGVHVLGGRPYELRTALAMTFRSALWCAIAFLLWRMERPAERRPGA